MLLQQARGNFAAIIMGTPHKLSESGSCGERTNDGMSELCRLRRNERYGVREDEAGFGEGTPQQDDHRGENEQKANFGTVVESCSKLLRTTPIAIFQNSAKRPLPHCALISKRAQKSTLDFLKNESAGLLQYLILDRRAKPPTRFENTF